LCSRHRFGPTHKDLEIQATGIPLTKTINPNNGLLFIQ